jgi:hypothetical protein
MPNIDLSILNQRQTPAFYADTLANRPAAGFVGRIFVSTDTFAFYRDNGTTWDLIGGPGTGTITGTGTANTFTIFTSASGIGNSSYLTQAANAINVASADINLPANNTVGGTNYGLYQTIATNDYWKIYGNSQTFDAGELVFEIGDNGASIALDRFRFTINDTNTGVDKDLLTLDFDESNLNTNLIVSSGYNLGVGVSVPSGLIHADGGASAARMIIDADNGIARIFSFRTDNLPRWALRVDGTETGSNVGGDFSIRRYDDTGAFVDAPLLITRSTGQSTFAKKVVIENNAGDQNLQIVSTTAPSIRIDNIQIGATKRAGLGISTATNNFIQGSADGDYCVFNSSTTTSPILFGIYDAGLTNTQEAARISAARNFLIGTTTDSGQKLIVNGTALITGGVTFNSTLSIITSSTVLSIDRTGAGTALIEQKTNGTVRGYIGADVSTPFIVFNESAAERFRINSSGSILLKGSSTTTNAEAIFENTNSLLSIESSASGAVSKSIRFNTSAGATMLERMRVTGDGTIGMGTSVLASINRLQVNTSTDINLGIRAAVDTTGAVCIQAVDDLANNNIPLEIRGSKNCFTTGNVIIGSSIDTGYKFRVNGSSYFYNTAGGTTDSATFVGNGSANALAIRTRTTDDYAFLNWKSHDGTEQLAETYIQRTAANTAILRHTINNGSTVALYMTVTSQGYIIPVLPTSASGLPTGALWNNLGIVSVAP